MELSEEKTLITHSSKHTRFLGYDICVRRNGKIKGGGKQKFTKRTLHNRTELSVPLDDKIHKFIFSRGIVKQETDGTFSPIRRAELLHVTNLEIVSSYNSELRGICNYYKLASKQKSSIRKITRKFKDGKGRWGIPYETKKGWKRCTFKNNVFLGLSKLIFHACKG